ncbi:hypothetical protein HELRODRAFT_160462 [Helobdella robusta]|uniref:Uncharacterized protein n=1 Tax=Helobdella robusta TaxID=6412 RepID=T1EQA1_HELRO|nr:hypothetical protein HELRODRAFT_160462 [Helobdella robusta]ESO06298.1 hypothetical protein HELRODRAFT_160462 [Helobdella robusta]
MTNLSLGQVIQYPKKFPFQKIRSHQIPFPRFYFDQLQIAVCIEYNQTETAKSFHMLFAGDLILVGDGGLRKTNSGSPSPFPWPRAHASGMPAEVLSSVSAGLAA